MLNWNNLDTLASYQELEKAERINLAEVMSGENGAERVKTYSTPIVDGLTMRQKQSMTMCSQFWTSLPKRLSW